MKLASLLGYTSLKSIFRIFVLCIFLGTNITLMIPTQAADNIENDTNSFIYYKQKIESNLLDLEREFRVNNTVSESTLSQLRGLVQEAYIRLPDGAEAGSKNEGLKKSADLYLDLASKNRSSTTNVQNAASQIATFLAGAQIKQITASIEANPTSGNAPMTTSFLANAKDPSGINIPDKNYTWWMKESGGVKKVLGSGPGFNYTFSKEGNYQIFLDVVSESRNKKGYPDVTPISVSRDIEVKPKLGNVILLINGINVSNLDTLKVSPSLGKIGLLFDASASRAVSNGTITKTKWDFGNGNVLEYDGSPVLEKQLYVNPEKYTVSIEIMTNQGQSFRKQLQLLVRDPAAVISLDKEVGYIDEDIPMSAKTYMTNTTNIDYSWEIQDIEGGKKALATKKGSNFSYRFSNVGQYIITLTTRSPNGNIDTDTRRIIIESRPPIVNLDSPRPISSERPNTILFNASKSFDPDTKNSKGLKYDWTIDGESVDLDNSEKDGSIGTYTFSEKGSHTVGLTVTNKYGKVTTVDKTFDVASTLTVGMNISPRASPLGNVINFQARSPQAGFYEWDVGDGSPTINGTTDFIQHIYKTTGVYNATLTVKNGNGTEENRISRKVYITDTNKPFALIEIKNNGTPALEESDACENREGAFIVNRAESTTLEGGNSINVDGNSAGLSYTWRYMDRVKIGPSVSEKFIELGCFPIELIVKSDKTGASHASTRYIQIKNIVPKLTSVTATVDGTKKDTQKIIANVVANGARDEDGVIRSYIWFYKTESDPEKQNVRITQSPNTSFVLPNVTEKYYFGVIIEDNDGARFDSTENESNQMPLLTANEDANINMPLISLNVVNLNKDRGYFLVDEVVQFSANAKNILGTDITEKSEYYWDFDGDSRIDQKTTTPQVSYTYKKSGKYNMKVKVINNGVTNTKYQVIYVKNELKASVKGYKIGDMVYFINTSRGSYDSTKWILGSLESTSLYGTSVPSVLLSEDGKYGTLTIKSGLNEVSTKEITKDDIEIQERSSSGIIFQTYPARDGNTVKITSPGEKLLIGMYGNSGNEYSIDTDTIVDSDLDAVGDNDHDNKESTSFNDGSVFAIDDLADSKKRTRDMKISIKGDDGKLIGSEIIRVILDYIPDSDNQNPTSISGTGGLGFSSTDKINLEKFQEKIRGFTPEDRIIFTQYYNNLIENWDDLHDRTEGLLTIQKAVLENTNFSESEKSALSEIIDIILVGDAEATNDVSVASRVIEGLIDTLNPNKDYITERLEKIKAHPGNLAENKILGKEILEKIEEDTAITTENKLLIKSQLLTILNGGQANIPPEEIKTVETPAIGSGILGFIGGTVKIFLLVLASICLLFLLGYIFYRLSRKSKEMGFQDYLIDSVAHTKRNTKPQSYEQKGTSDTSSIIIPTSTPIVTPEIVTSPVTTQSGIAKLDQATHDPLETIGVYHEVPSNSGNTTPSIGEAPMIEVASPTVTKSESQSIPDWLKPVKDDSDSIVVKPGSSSSPLVSEAPMIEVASPTVTKSESQSIPDWLKPVKDDSDSIVVKPGSSSSPLVGEISIPTGSPENSGENNYNIETLDTIQSPQAPDLLSTTEHFTSLAPDNAELIPQSPLEIPGENSSINNHQESLGKSPMSISTDAAEGSTPTGSSPDLIPDWLKPISEEQPTEEVAPANQDSTDNQEGVPIITPSPDSELPDWLKSSLDQGGDTTEKVKKEKKPRKPKIEQHQTPGATSESDTQKKSTSSPAHSSDNIPDWLK